VLRWARRLAATANGAGDVSALDSEIAGMERLYENVIVPWQPQARLKELARQSPPPQSWYDEESQPL
jgi:hypothetical protein